MKKTTIFLLLSLIIISACKEHKTQGNETPISVENVLQKIADAHGFASFKEIQTIHFTFNVKRDSSHFKRSWRWDTKTNNVTGQQMGKSIRYNRKKLDSTTTAINAAFINDKYWLLAPFQLIWDASNFKSTHTLKASAPISNKQMQKLTIVYGKEGGITPGDAYDFYFEDDYILKEWAFRKSNQSKASMTTTWEAYKRINDILIAYSHKKENENFELFFTDLKIE